MQVRTGAGVLLVLAGAWLFWQGWFVQTPERTGSGDGLPQFVLYVLPGAAGAGLSPVASPIDYDPQAGPFHQR